MKGIEQSEITFYVPDLLGILWNCSTVDQDHLCDESGGRRWEVRQVGELVGLR